MGAEKKAFRHAPWPCPTGQTASSYPAIVSAGPVPRLTTPPSTGNEIYETTRNGADRFPPNGDETVTWTIEPR